MKPCPRVVGGSAPIRSFGNTSPHETPNPLEFLNPDESVNSVNAKVAVITGSGSGIGRATAHSLARRGATILVSDIDLERAKQVAKNIQAVGGRAEGARCDVSNAEDVAALAEDTLLVLTDHAAESMLHEHAADRNSFLASQIHRLERRR